MIFYNENDPFAAQWLENLAGKNLIRGGKIERKSITEIKPGDLAGFTTAHFFAGIGGWELALQLAGWPKDLPVWTGSCPCQPFSQIGRRLGAADERDLWPFFRQLISERRPSVVFGEQVGSLDGRVWLAGVRSDLEALGFTIGATDLCAASIGAPHARQRIFWVAYSGRLGDSKLSGLERHPGDGGERNEPGRIPAAPHGSITPPSHWSDAIWISCLDGKIRRIKPGIEPLVDGIPGRVGRLRAYGNAIVPQLAAQFIRAVMETLEIMPSQDHGRV